MKIIKIINPTEDKPTSQEQRVMQDLFSYKLPILENFFYNFLDINVPIDIYQESDFDIIKSNICRILTYFIIQLWKGQAISLYDKMYMCNQCSKWAYFQSIKKNTCIICLDKDQDQEVYF